MQHAAAAQLPVYCMHVAEGLTDYCRYLQTDSIGGMKLICVLR
jgi:hypothetical protein